MFPRLCLAAALVCLGACGKDPEEPLEEIAVRDLQGAWLMVNRSADCRSDLTRFASTGIFRVYADNRPRKAYAKIAKVVLDSGKITFEVSEIAMGGENAGTMAFSLLDRKLRLIDMKTPDGQSFKEPAANLAPARAANLKNIFRISEQRFAMDRCPGA